MKMTPGDRENLFIEPDVPNNTYFEPEILSLVLLDGILSPKYQKITNLTLQYDLADLEDDTGKY